MNSLFKISFAFFCLGFYLPSWGEFINLPSGNFIINSLDTVIFDLSRANCSANKMEFPVFIESDETVFAIDFSMKYDVAKISFDSLFVLKSYLSTSINFNAADSTLRFSAFSGQPIDIDSALFKLRFNRISGLPDSSAFIKISTYLNGDSCSNVMSDFMSRPYILPVGPLTILPGDSLTLSVNPTPGYSYEWSTGDTTTSIVIVNDGTYSLTAINQNGCTASTEIDVNSGIILPVELINFNVIPLFNHVKIKWSTASETGNDYFIVEKSSGAEWFEIALINGAGNSHVIQNYETTDTPLPGFNYYRLKQVDFNGSLTYSSIVIFINKPEQNIIVTPNPFTEKITIWSRQEIRAQLFDGDGKLLETFFLSEGDNQLQIKKFPAGNCFLKIIDHINAEVKNLVHIY